MKCKLLAGLGLSVALLFSSPVAAQRNSIITEDFTYGTNLGVHGDKEGYNVGFSVIPGELNEQNIKRITVKLIATDGKVLAENVAIGKGLKNLIDYEGQKYSTQFYPDRKKMKEDVWVHSVYCGQKPNKAEIIIEAKDGKTHKAENTNVPPNEMKELQNCKKAD
jgi:hypothetical protein